MIVGVVGSRGIPSVDLTQYLPLDCTEIVSGGAKGVDQCAAAYARQNNIKLTEFLPEYKKYGKGAPIVRNRLIVDYADKVIAFWDGKSGGTLSVIRYCQKAKKHCQQ